MAELSPMMKQYFEIKENNKDSIVFFRLGDFYEMFYEDAKIASKELELSLTGRDCGQKERAPMCGVPFHSCETYIAKLVSKGYKVAICEQTEDPATAKGLVKRDIVRVITPGTVMESSMLDESRNNYISCIYIGEKACGICFCDISTGSLSATKLDRSESEQNLKNELSHYNPTEILAGGDILGIKALREFAVNKLSTGIELVDDKYLDFDECIKNLLDIYSVNSLSELGLESDPETAMAVSVLMGYLKRTQKTGLQRISKPEIYVQSKYMRLDYNAMRNLEIVETMRSKDKRGSLLWVLDKTKTAMGKRLIRSWIEKPLVNCVAILKRQNAVAEFVNNTVALIELREVLNGVFDIERLITRIVYGTANARELRSLCSALKCIPEVKRQTSGCRSQLLNEHNSSIDELSDICNLIDEAIVEDPPFSVREGGMIKEGYNSELDTLTHDMKGGQGILAEVEAREREATGIPKLKIGFNRVFGYYIEVSNSYKEMVPKEYIRKQTLSNCERYITEELKHLEGRILGAKDRAYALEYSIFDEIRNKVAEALPRIEKTADAVANIDVLSSLAQVASDNRYVAPIINNSGIINLKDSRHPVVECVFNSVPFVPNDVYLNKDSDRAAIITGPNMAGKSTYMRQVAIIVIMAQIGSFVPASSAEIGIVDAVFTRVGASDDLTSGQSTFMVEMKEVADIIKNATSDSLLILDEIGRGTSTFDGMSIARAVLEYAADKRKLGAKTLFATHYHELTVMGDVLKGVRNYSIAVKKRGDDITFLRRIVKGGADDSFGIEVAKLAGIPDSIISRAKQILKELEKGGSPKPPKAKAEEEQPQLFNIPDMSEKEITRKLKNIDINTLTPIESMNILFELIKMVND